MVRSRNSLVRTALALAVAGTLLLVAAPATAEQQIDTPETSSTTTIPPCGDGFVLVDKGPVTVGLDPFCSPYVEDDVTASAIPPCGTGYEESAGPATVGYDPYCQLVIDVDEDWEPGLATTSSHMQPSDNPVKCFLDADSGVERWACFFGPPGP